MEGYLVARYVIIGILVAGVAILVGRGIWREFRDALAKDKKQRTTKFVKGKLAEYGIVLVVGLMALVAVSYLKGGPLKSWSEQLYGKPAPTISIDDNPFYKR